MDSRTPTKTTELSNQLARVGLRATARDLNDIIARATQHRWSPATMLEEIARAEAEDRAHRGLETRLRNARIGRFKPIADFEWSWPTKIDRPLIEAALCLDFIKEARNLILLGANGLGKTMIAQNIAYQAVLAGHSVIFRTAPDLLSDLATEFPHIRRRKLAYYGRPALLCIDEVGYLSYDSSAADLLYEVVNRRYERASLLITTNRAFKDWDTVFPNAACIATMLDRLTHHADVTLIEGQSYRLRESEMEAAARRKNR
ncbi:MAG TPA: IS21-like element helper ATPase IstB [Blastocatellia bacterium]|nr:IS21-like element helper ATPase IstB [Blastocatellia bacterium]